MPWTLIPPMARGKSESVLASKRLGRRSLFCHTELVLLLLSESDLITTCMPSLEHLLDF